MQCAAPLSLFIPLRKSAHRLAAGLKWGKRERVKEREGGGGGVYAYLYAQAALACMRAAREHRQKTKSISTRPRRRPPNSRRCASTRMAPDYTLGLDSIVVGSN